jgi:hypothetical protein
MATGKTKAPPEDYDTPDEGVFEENRRCLDCQKPLSRYNPNDKCYVCLEREFKALIAAPPPPATRRYIRKYTKFMKDK